jgi:hypothetical protein
MMHSIILLSALVALSVATAYNMPASSSPSTRTRSACNGDTASPCACYDRDPTVREPRRTTIGIATPFQYPIDIFNAHMLDAVTHATAHASAQHAPIQQEQRRTHTQAQARTQAQASRHNQQQREHHKTQTELNMDVRESAREFEMLLDVPGVAKNDVQVTHAPSRIHRLQSADHADTPPLLSFLLRSAPLHSVILCFLPSLPPTLS